MTKKIIQRAILILVLPAIALLWKFDISSVLRRNTSQFRKILAEMRSSHSVAVSISPDGKYVLKKDELKNGFEIAIIEKASGKMITKSFSENTQRALTWSPDGNSIFYQEIDGLNRPLFLWDVKSGARKIVSVPISKTALPPIRWAPNGKQYIFFSGDWEKGRLLLCDREGVTPPIIVKKSLSANCDFAWSGAGDNIAVIAESEPGCVTFINVKRLTSVKNQLFEGRTLQTLAWSPDGEKLLVCARGKSDEFYQLYQLGLNTQKDGSVKVAQLSKCAETTGDIVNPVWLSDNKAFVYHTLFDGIMQARLVRPDHTHSTVIGPTNGVFRVTHVDPDGKSLYGRFASFSVPPVLLEVDVESGRAREIYAPEHSKHYSSPEPASVRIPSFDGVLVPSYHWAAKAVDPSKRIAIIEAHGGLNTQTFPTWEPYVEVLADRGCDVIAVNYRGSSGYGQKYEKLGDEAGRARDIVAARNYAVDKLKISPERVFLMGNSHGASLSAAAAVHGKIGGLLLISWPESPPDGPLNIKSDIKVLGFHGELDPFVSPEKAEKTVDDLFAMSEARITSKWYPFKDEGHFFYRADSWAMICDETLKLAAGNN